MIGLIFILIYNVLDFTVNVDVTHRLLLELLPKLLLEPLSEPLLESVSELIV